MVCSNVCFWLIHIFTENQFRGVNKDEVAFLDQVAQQAFQHEKRINDEVNKELQDYRISFLKKTLFRCYIKFSVINQAGQVLHACKPIF